MSPDAAIAGNRHATIARPTMIKAPVTAAAIGNSLSVEAAGEGLNLSNNQFFRGDAISTLNGHVEDVQGEVAMTSAAIANSASYDVQATDWVNITNYQTTNIDPRAYSNVGVSDVTGNVSSTTAAISNSLSVSTLPQTSDIRLNSTQLNNAYTGAIANATISDVAGDVSATAAAIGNSVSVSSITEF